MAKNAPEVEIIADGTNKATIIFPKGSKLKGKRKVSVSAIMALLDSGDVQGQEAFCDPLTCGQYVRT
jgi:hypothetical protein